MTEYRTYSGRPWAPGELCGECGTRIDGDGLCQCVDVLRARIDQLVAEREILMTGTPPEPPGGIEAMLKESSDG